MSSEHGASVESDWEDITSCDEDSASSSEEKDDASSGEASDNGASENDSERGRRKPVPSCERLVG